MSERRKLPDGWKWVHFGEIVDNFDGRRVPLKLTDRSQRKGKYPYYGASGIIDSIDDYLFDGEYLLIGEDGANLLNRSTPIAFKASGKFWVNNHAHVIKPKDTTTIDFLIHYFAVTDLSPFVSGSAQPKLSQASLNTIPVPLPPIQEQRRIVAALEERLAAVARARAAARAQLAAARALPAAYLRAVFEGEEARGWTLVSVRSLCHKIDYGYTASADFGIEFPKFLRITDIQNGKVDWDSVPGCRIGVREEEANRLHHEDIVFARTGGTVGKSFLIESPPPSVFASYLIRLIPNDEVLPHYLYYFFQSDSYWQQVRDNARGGAQPNVNAQILGNMKLRVPGIVQQEKIVAALRSQLESVDTAVNALENQLAEIELLPAAYLHQAFRGELT